MIFSSSSLFTFSFLFFIVVQVQLSPFLPYHSPPCPTLPASHPQTDPLWLCPCVLYICYSMDLPLISPTTPLHSPLWLLSVCSLFHCFWLYFACLFVLLIVPFMTAWMELESIMLSEVSQVVKDKQHDLTYRWNLINKTNKQAK